MELCDILRTNWAKEASPTLGCSIKISRDIICNSYNQLPRGLAEI